MFVGRLVKTQRTGTTRQCRQVFDTRQHAANQRDVPIQVPRRMTGYDVQLGAAAAARFISAADPQHAVAMQQPGAVIVPARWKSVHESNLGRVGIAAVNSNEIQACGGSIKLRRQRVGRVAMVARVIGACIRVAPLGNIVLLRADDGEAVEIATLNELANIGDMRRRKCGRQFENDAPESSSITMTLAASGRRQSAAIGCLEHTGSLLDDPVRSQPRDTGSTGPPGSSSRRLLADTHDQRNDQDRRDNEADRKSPEGEEQAVIHVDLVEFQRFRHHPAEEDR